MLNTWTSDCLCTSRPLEPVKVLVLSASEAPWTVVFSRPASAPHARSFHGSVLRAQVLPTRCNTNKILSALDASGYLFAAHAHSSGLRHRQAQWVGTFFVLSFPSPPVPSHHPPPRVTPSKMTPLHLPPPSTLVPRTPLAPRALLPLSSFARQSCSSFPSCLAPPAQNLHCLPCTPPRACGGGRGEGAAAGAPFFNPTSIRLCRRPAERAARPALARSRGYATGHGRPTRRAHHR